MHGNGKEDLKLGRKSERLFASWQLHSRYCEMVSLSADVLLVLEQDSHKQIDAFIASQSLDAASEELRIDLTDFMHASPAVTSLPGPLLL